MKSALKPRLVLGVFAVAFCVGNLSADEIRIPLGQQDATPEWRTTQPTRGSTKGQIEEQYGAPQTRNGPNGDPPIYFWEYADFTVYFEGDHVIHAVSKHLKSAQ